MKTIETFIIKSAGLILWCSLLSSCYSYKPYLNDLQISSEVLREKIAPGKKYEVLTTDSKKLTIKVDSVTNDRLIGDASWKVNTGQSKNPQQISNQTIYQKKYSILFNQIKSIKERKISAGKTIAAIAIPIGILVLIGIHSVNNLDLL